MSEIGFAKIGFSQFAFAAVFFTFITKIGFAVFFNWLLLRLFAFESAFASVFPRNKTKQSFALVLGFWIRFCFSFSQEKKKTIRFYFSFLLLNSLLLQFFPGTKQNNLLLLRLFAFEFSFGSVFLRNKIIFSTSVFLRNIAFGSVFLRNKKTIFSTSKREILKRWSFFFLLF